MIKHLEKIRSKPIHERKRLAFFLSVGATFVIFMFWLSSFGHGSGGTSNVASNSYISPFESIKNSVASAYDSIKRTGEIINKDFNKKSQEIEVISGDSSQ